VVGFLLLNINIVFSAPRVIVFGCGFGTYHFIITFIFFFGIFECRVIFLSSSSFLVSFWCNYIIIFLIITTLLSLLLILL